ncbi:MAG: cytidylate kinase-like family protein [Lachnospiraceae bacterium]|nr:cytidylate kinase-like family protein [Lachnospiraceae bacterium]
MLITIGRECGCGADEIGKILSDKYGIPFYAKSELVKYAKEKGIYEKYPYFFGEVPTDFFMSSLDENVMERVRNTPKEALGKLIQDKDCIIIGRTSNFVFRDKDDSVRIFLCANVKYRIAQIAMKHNLSMDKARKLVEETDERRKRYHQYYTGEEWGYAGNYDLTMDVSELGIQGVINVVDAFITSRESERNLKRG